MDAVQRGCRLGAFGAAVGLALWQGLPSARAADAGSSADLATLSLEELAQIDITSVSKKSEPLSDAAAAIYVISHDDIIRSGASSIPEILRLAPNLQVAQVGASAYAISAQGANGQLADKLLVLIDGRSVYSPLFGGVYWDMQSVLPEDIERIEVISGPGATLWGANAVNGVINIITRNAGDTQGGVLAVGGGNIDRHASLQYGGKISDDLAYRVYAVGYDDSSFKASTGASAHDDWSRPEGGFRLDWTPPGDAVSLQGDIYHLDEDQTGGSGTSFGGADFVVHWDHPLADGAALQLLTYYDEAKRYTDDGGGGLKVTTYDLEIQHDFALGSWNAIVWGAGERIDWYRIDGVPTLFFVPPGGRLNLADLFVQDSISLSNSVKLTIGTKLEDEPYAGLQWLPSGRLSWKLDDTTLLWSAISRAVRAPTPFDTNLEEKQGSVDFLNGSTGFLPEELTAYEIGTRVQPTPRTSFSLSGFYNVYDDLRSIEITPATVFPLRFGNGMEGLIYGLEAWGSYRVTDWWRLTAGFNVQHEHLRFEPGSSGLGGISTFGDDPNHQASLRSSVDLGSDVVWDADLRHVGALPDPSVPSYTEFNTRIGWKISDTLELSVSGFNLLHPRHEEFMAESFIEEVPRSFFVETRWRF